MLGEHNTHHAKSIGTTFSGDPPRAKERKGRYPREEARIECMGPQCVGEEFTIILTRGENGGTGGGGNIIPTTLNRSAPLLVESNHA